MDKKAYAQKLSSQCAYWRMGHYYNHGGYLPCGQCEPCRQQAASDARQKQWNEETAAGKSPTR